MFRNKTKRFVHFHLKKIRSNNGKKAKYVELTSFKN